MVTKQEIADNIRFARQAKGMSQKELATKIGIPQPRIAEYESGLYSITGETIAAIATALECPIEIIIPNKRIIRR